jgi:hypothetical protein
LETVTRKEPGNTEQKNLRVRKVRMGRMEVETRRLLPSGGEPL